MRVFIDASRPVGVGHRAVVNASLGVLRRSCAPTVPSHLSKITASVLLAAVESVARGARAPVTGNIYSLTWQPGLRGGGARNQQQQPPCSPWRGPLELGGDHFPEAHMAGFLVDATTRIGDSRGGSDDGNNPRASPRRSIILSAQLASKVSAWCGSTVLALPRMVETKFISPARDSKVKEMLVQDAKDPKTVNWHNLPCDMRALHDVANVSCLRSAHV